MFLKNTFTVPNWLLWILLGIASSSPANGKVASDSIEIAPSPRSQFLPFAAVGSWKGVSRTYVAWLEEVEPSTYDVFLTFSEKPTEKFSKPIRLTRPHERVSRLDQGGPQIGIDQSGVVTLVWTTERGVRLVQSTDGAKHFKNSHYLSLGRKKNHCHASLSVHTNGKSYLAWNEGSELLYSVFESGKSQPQVPKKILRTDFGEARECSRVTTNVNSNGVVSVAYQGKGSTGGYGVFSTDGGKTFGVPLKITESENFLIALDDMNQIVRVYFTSNKSLQAEYLDLTGKSLGPSVPLPQETAGSSQLWDLFFSKGSVSILGGTFYLWVLEGRGLKSTRRIDLPSSNAVSDIRGIRGRDVPAVVYAQAYSQSVPRQSVRLRSLE